MNSEWTVDTLKEYVDTRFEAIREAILKAERSAEQRAEKLETETRARFENVNEWRTTYGDQQTRFMPRAEHDQAVKSLREKIESKNVQVVASLGVGFVGLLMAVFNLATRLAS